MERQLFFTTWEQKPEGSMLFCSASARNIPYLAIHYFPCYSRVSRWHENVTGVDLEVTNNFQLVGELANTYYVKKEDKL